MRQAQALWFRHARDAFPHAGWFAIADPDAFTILQSGDLSDLGDTSTLAEPAVVDELITNAGPLHLPPASL